MKLAAALVSCALCVTSTAGGVLLSRPADVDYGPVLAQSASRYAVFDEDGEPTRWYVVGESSETTGASPVTRVPADSDTAPQLPWTIDVTYSLDGPNLSAAEVVGASGLVGVHITVRPSHTADNSANRTVPIIAFTIPSQVSDDVSASDGVSVSTQGGNSLVAAVGRSGSGLELSCYMNAKRFAMSPIALAVVPVDVSDGGAVQQPADNTDTAAGQLASTSSTLVDSLTDAGSGAHQQLIDQLKALRANEQQLAQTVTAEREATHQRTFEAYMAAYVGSYTTHLSGSIGTSTQLPALVGTAGELSGDTPLAQAVIDLADAVNNASAAHMHAGAVDALDEVIRRIQQQGTTGLVDDLTKEAAEEATKGSQQYSAGQKQLSAAMIPYSMTYTDVYTSKLSALTGGTSAGATAYAQQAIAQTNASDGLKDSQAKVDVAMDALAAACEHTGKSQALRQILLRFSDQFASGVEAAGDSGDSDGSGAETLAGESQVLVHGLADVQSQSFYGRTKAAEAKRKAERARQQAQAAQREQSQDTQTSLVDDTMSMSASDVMSYANGLTSAIGGGSGNDAGSSAGDNAAGTTAGTAASQGAGQSAQSGTDAGRDDSGVSSDSRTDADDDAAPMLFGFGQGGTLLTHDYSVLIGETVEIGDAGRLIAQAIPQLGSGVPASALAVDTPAYLVVISSQR